MAEADREARLPAGTVTFLFTDIEGSTRLWESQRGAMDAALARHDALLRECIVGHGGHVIKTIGDGFHAVFATAPAALEASLAAQHALHAEPWPDAVRIRVRMGLHTGEAAVRDGDYYGTEVNRAARVAALGHGGQTLLSEATHALCRDRAPADVHFKPLGEHALRGLARRETVFEMSHPALPQAFPPLNTLLASIDERTPSIAVLPFTNLSAEKDQEYFTDGLAEEFLNLLSKIPGLRVASRTSAFSFKGMNMDIPTIGKRLNVATILDGSVRKAGNRLRIGTQLVDVATDSTRWSQAYDRELDDIFAVQDEIARAVVTELRAELLDERGEAASKASVAADVEAAAEGRGSDAEAYQLYLQGRYFADRHAEEDTQRAIAYFRQAIAVDPGYALAWAHLARAYADQAAYAWAPYAESFARAREAAEHALALAPALAEGHAALGFVSMANDRNWAQAHASFRRALELAPGNAAILRDVAIMAACLGRQDEAIALLRRAVTLDPLSARAHRVLGSRYISAGLVDPALASLSKALELNPHGDLTHFWLGTVDVVRGRLESARASFLREPNAVLRLVGLAIALHATGDLAQSRAALDELQRDHADHGATQIAWAYAYIGEADQAFSWLERADAQRDPGLIEINAHIHIRNLQGDPRWQAWLARLGLAGTSV
ncbi:MAG TPA: adenylate/guanylate cyclase domain-containing protein [Casimicrobiaceae bacterium]|nr:adenylate/guanylate cyclase domain-containing protein [Casimicrobiaceae bacterium]